MLSSFAANIKMRVGQPQYVVEFVSHQLLWNRVIEEKNVLGVEKRSQCFLERNLGRKKKILNWCRISSRYKVLVFVSDGLVKPLHQFHFLVGDCDFLALNKLMNEAFCLDHRQSIIKGN